MKPTVISGGDNTNAPSNPAANNNNNNPNNNQQDDNTNQNIHGSQRQFPSHFQSGFGFGPSLVDDMFADDDFRPHTTTRMRDPWGFGARKRCGNMPNEDLYRRYLADDSDLFPGFQDPDWDSMRGRRRVAPQQQNSAPGSEPRSDFFDHIPAHFRSYIPDSFGFSNMRHQPNTAASAATDHSQSYPPRPQQQYCEPQAQRQTNHSTEAQPQYYQPQPQQQPQQQQQQPPRPKFCDASIQTEDDLNAGTPHSPTDQGQNLNQHGLRNTVDLGQKSPQEEPREPRAQSAPPVNDANHNYASASSSAYAFAGPGNGQTSATTYASTGTNPQTPTSGPQQPAFNRQRPQPNNPPQPPQRHHIPQYQAPPQYQQHQQAPPQPSSHEEGSGFVRHVPIFIEGRSEPVNTPQQQQRKPPAPKAQPHQEHHRPTPLNTQQAQAHAQVPAPAQSPEVPQTPHTTASINKIQNIQRDVLDLMTKVEQFKGAKKDKEYMYLDEMLTRNLLSLDTIDTNGKDSIRLARREAIKCIEASINVLEAKAEENARIAQQTVMDVENPAAAQFEAVAETEVPTEEAEAIASAEATSKAESSPVQNDKTKKNDETVPKPNEDPKDITPESKAPEEPAVETPSSAEGEPQEPCNEITEKSSTEKPPKAPGSPKKKIVRKVKKIADKKDSQDDGKTEGETEPTKEDAASEASAAESSAADTRDGKSEEKQ